MPAVGVPAGIVSDTVTRVPERPLNAVLLAIGRRRAGRRAGDRRIPGM